MVQEGIWFHILIIKRHLLRCLDISCGCRSEALGEKEERVWDISVVAFNGQVTNCFGGSRLESLLL